MIKYTVCKFIVDFLYQLFNSIYKYFLLYIEYVKLIHAPTEIKKAQFSSAISLRCRHVRHGTKKKLYVSPSKKLKNVQNEKQHTENEDIENDEDIENNENVPDASNEVIVEDATEDKENSIDIF